MYQPSFRRKSNNVPVLGKNDIDHFAERFIEDYSPNLLETPGELDIDRFLTRYLGLNLEYHYLSHNGLYLGMMVFGDTKKLPVFNPEKQEAKYISVPAKTVIIDQSLLSDETEQRYRFTAAHEGGHGILHPDYYGYNKDQLSFFGDSNAYPLVKCRAATVTPGYSNSSNALVTDDDWMEWQANYFASALLMPKSMVLKVYADLEADDFTKDFYAVKAVAEIFNVSRAAAENRLSSLGIIKKYEITIGDSIKQEVIQ